MSVVDTVGRLAVAQAVASGVAFGACGAYARWVAAGSGDRAEKVYRLQRASLALIVASVALAVLLFFVWFLPLVRPLADQLAVVGVPWRPVIVLVGASVLLGSILATTIAGQAGWFPQLQALADVGGTRSSFARRLGVALAVSYGKFVAIGAVVALSPGVSGALAIVGFVVALALVEPYILDWSHDTRPAPARYEAELDAIADATGVPVAGLKVFDGRGGSGGTAGVVGLLPRHRYVYVTDGLWEALSPAERRGVLAHELGHVAGGHLRARTISFAALAVSLGAVFGTVGGFLAYAVVGAACLGFLWVFGRLTHRHEYQADAYASRQVGAETVIRALERLGELNYTKPERGSLFNLLVEHPSLADRVARIQGD